MSTDLHDVLARGTATPTREPDLATIWHRGRRRRRGRLLATCILAGSFVSTVAITVSLVAVGPAAPVRVVTAPDQWTTYRDDAHGLSISYPPFWHVSPVTDPILIDPIVPFAVGTYPLEPNRTQECNIMFPFSLGAFGPTDAFIAVLVSERGQQSFNTNVERPSHVTPDLLRLHGGVECPGNVHGSRGSVGFLDHGRQIVFLVVMGSEITPERQQELYEILDSLVVAPPGAVGKAR